ncbi:hypothetical protein FPZ54_06625 [Sphingomonas suaedae]|uniref:Uncharacterized protein n=1 Tax=Sphingomonas suaedae TaxID=2599297 RepID=A0A518RE59_9SPHN|nr:hypothetical protein [Sphingomonas suaedae]QDX25723.1 hypothetical protein FPZ54_06625 [Sphingomonas suaedae]
MQTVYLDTSDYSRFGDVLRGKGDPQTERIFDQLIRLKEGGVAQFAYSMPVLSELLQYDEDHAETTTHKAQAVEMLCGSNAFIWPGRLIAWEVSVAAAKNDLSEHPLLASPLSEAANWFPNVEGALDDLKGGFQRTLNEALADITPVNRKQRRTIEAHVRKLSMTKMVNAAAPEFADKYGLKVSDVQRSLIAVLEDKISPSEGAKRLFSAIATPTTFIHTYFKGYDGKKDFPAWMSSLGAKLQSGLMEGREKLSAIDISLLSPDFIRSGFEETAPEYGSMVLRLASSEATEFGLEQAVIDLYAHRQDLANEVSCWRNFTRFIPAFMMANLGLRGDGYAPERSAGGDIIHSFYLPYCDLWRGDRRFSHILKQALPDQAHRIVSRLADLPKLVEAGASDSPPHS